MINAAAAESLEVDDMVREVEFVLEEEDMLEEEEVALEVEVDLLEVAVGASTLGVDVLDVVGVLEDVVVLEVVLVVDDGDESFGQWVKVLSLFAAWLRSAFSFVHTL